MLGATSSEGFPVCNSVRTNCLNFSVFHEICQSAIFDVTQLTRGAHIFRGNALSQQSSLSSQIGPIRAIDLYGSQHRVAAGGVVRAACVSSLMACDVNMTESDKHRRLARTCRYCGFTIIMVAATASDHRIVNLSFMYTVHLPNAVTLGGAYGVWSTWSRKLLQWAVGCSSSGGLGYSRGRQRSQHNVLQLTSAGSAYTCV